ncbi:MAG: hypothetical protein ACXVRJ_03285 [Gaiellaceae bacterium]
MTLGPQQMPPQGARALVRALLGGRRRAPEVTATLDELDPDAPVLELANIGGTTAIDVRFMLAGRDEQAIGDLAPGASVQVRVQPLPWGPVACEWTCRGRRGRTYRWSY